MEPPTEDRKYTGDFDWMVVVRAASLPKEHSVREHRKAWAHFHHLFEEEWKLYGGQ